MSDKKRKIEKKELSLREIQRMSNCIELMKGQFAKGEKEETKEISPNYTVQWDATVQYWMGRLKDWCAPIGERITETRNSLVKKYGVKNDTGGFDFEGENGEIFDKEIKNLLDQKEKIRFPELKASMFVKMKERKAEESLVPIDFWEAFGKHIVMDVPEFDFEDVEEEETISVDNGQEHA